MAEFETSFSFACPKFLSPVPPNYDAAPVNFHKIPFNMQLKVFLEEVYQQQLLPTIRRSVKFFFLLVVYSIIFFYKAI
jgi:translation initiation factor 3 subunit L